VYRGALRRERAPPILERVREQIEAFVSELSNVLHVIIARARRIVEVSIATLAVGMLVAQLGLIRADQAERVGTSIRSMTSEGLIRGQNLPAFHTYHARVAIGNGCLFGAGR